MPVRSMPIRSCPGSKRPVTDVENVRREANHWDAKANGKDGKQVSVDVDPKTGTVTPEDEKSGGRQLAFGYR